MLLVGLFAAANIAFAEEELFDTKEANSYFEQGIKYLQTKKLDSAVTALEESVSIAPNAEAYYFLGYAYYLKGRSGDAESRKKAIENFENAYELEPGFTPTKYKPENVMPKPESIGKDQEPAVTAPGKPVLEATTPPQVIDAGAKQQKQQ